MMRVGVFALLAHASLARGVHAQSSGDAWSSARFHAGPLALGPTIGVTSGVDTNVLASPDDPQKDWTTTFGVATTAILRLGRATLTGQVGLSYLYFPEFESERSLSGSGSGRLLVPLNRVEFVVGVQTLNTADRQDSEITARVRQFDHALTLETSVRVSGKSWIGVTAGRRRNTFADDEVFLGADLSTSLDRDENRAGIVFRNQLTPLTTLRVTGELQRDRFHHAEGRNADRSRLVGGLEMNPFAILRGNASIGYEKFEPSDFAVPGYAGVVASADLTYVLRGATRMSLLVDRGLGYSYDATQPYYVLTSIGGTVGRHIVKRLEGFASVSRERTSYRSVETAANTDSTRRRDWFTTLGAGLGWDFGRSSSVTLNYVSSERDSAVAAQNYDSRRLTASLDYTF